MPRPPRQLFAGGTYHVTARGNNGDDIFRADHDRATYLALLAKAAGVTAVRVLAYALMPNHLHLVVHTPTPNLHILIHRTHRTYALSYNRECGRSGHLFGSRYYSKPVRDDTQLLETTRYVHLNPVIAGLVRSPEDFPWSSYRSYIDPQADSTLVDPGPVHDLLALTRGHACAAYQRFVLSALEVPGAGNIG